MKFKNSQLVVSVHARVQSGLRFKRALFKRIAGLREVKMAWHITLLNRTHILLNRTYPNPPRLVQHCYNPLENLSTAVVESIIEVARHTALSYTPCSTMSCAAGSLCIAKPDHTPGSPLFTNHKCRVCGTYLHGMCGLPTRRATTRCDVSATDASTPTTARN